MTHSTLDHTARGNNPRRRRRARIYISIAVCVVLVLGAAAAIAAIELSSSGYPIHSTQYVRYLGVYEPDAPNSYGGVDQFAQAIGRQPNLVSYYSPWLEPFETDFVTTAAKHGALTVVQIDPKNVSLASIATGRYDGYLNSYATAVKAFGGQVVLSFGHEMNGNWYSWSYGHSSPTTFVAAWRHVVNVFRTAGARNVTWLWTVNIIDENVPIPSPKPWWPGKSYVNWVGIDGYYYLPSSSFAQVFGPTIVNVRALTGDPILLAETGALPAVGQSEKINDLFAGIRTYGLLGFVWFDENDEGRVWRISGPKAFAALRRDANTFMQPPVITTEPSSASASS